MKAGWAALFSIAALVCVLAARVFGPSDMWDNTQPKTISYTTDIIVHGGWHWLLPIERGELPATKPPLYNWLAVPFVELLGFRSEVAQKMPSVIALCVCWLALVRLGRAIDPAGEQLLGWFAGLMFLANATMFKLGYLARPDMVLTMWLLGAWMCATAVFIHRRTATGQVSTARWLTRAFWTCVALAALTKGPAAIAVIVYAFVGARLIGGSWRSLGWLGLLWGLPFVVIVIGGWAFAVWKIDPQHLYHELWHEEIYGRVTGLGTKGGHEGWFATVAYQLLYFFTRYFPWSLPAVAAMVTLARAGRQSRDGRNVPHPCVLWVRGAASFVIVVVGLYTLSAGKRADYIAAAFAPASLLASWWLLHAPPHYTASSNIVYWRRHVKWIVPAAAAACVAVLTTYNFRETSAPVRGFGDAIRRFVNQASDAMAQEPALPVAFCWVVDTHLQAMLGASTKDGKETVDALLQTGHPFWVVAGRKQSFPADFGDWLLGRNKAGQVEVHPVVRSQMLPRAEGWPEQVSLFRVVPVPGTHQREKAPGA